MGLIRDQDINQVYKDLIISIQNKLFIVGAVLATDPKKAVLKNGKERLDIDKISENDIKLLEDEIDAMNENLQPMTHFVLPGGHQTVSFCHVARCVCRRAERLASELYELEPFEINTLIYLNRLSDYLFVLSRKLALDLQANEIKWIPERS